MGERYAAAMPTPLPLAGRKIVVTGATSGIGAGLTEDYAAAGARVFATGRDESRLPDASESVVPIAADLITEAGPRSVATAIEHAGGVVDVVVHAAGLLGPRATPLVEYPDDEWDRVFEVNVTAVHRLHRLLVPALDRSDAAVVIGISSTVGREGRAGWGMYAVSKHALEGWLATLAHEFAGRVHSVNPGGTRTPMRAAAVPDEDPGTLPTPADIAPVFLHLAHPGASEPTGSLFDARDWIGRDPWEGISSRPEPAA